MFFQFLSTIKVNLVAKIIQSAYLCVNFHIKHKELPFVAVLTWFLLPGKIQDGDHCWWSHRPPESQPPLNISHLVKKIKGFPPKVKSFQNTATYQKLRGGVPSTLPPPPPTPCTTVGVWIWVYVRGLSLYNSTFLSFPPSSVMILLNFLSILFSCFLSSSLRTK